MAAAAILNFREMSITLDWIQISTPKFMGRCTTAMRCLSMPWNHAIVIHTYAPDIHLMTSRELNSGLDFWSAGHPRMVVVHLTIKFGVDICVQSRVIDISLKFKMAAAAIVDFQLI